MKKIAFVFVAAIVATMSMSMVSCGGNTACTDSCDSVCDSVATVDTAGVDTTADTTTVDSVKA